jgi:hypothetical protein
MDDDHGVARVVLAGEHVTEFHRGDLLFQPSDGGVEVGNERLVFKLAGDFDLLGGVLRPGADAVELLRPGFVILDLLEQGVGRFLVVPEIGCRRDLFQVAYFFLALIDVKDTPVTGSGGARWRAGGLFRRQT